MRAGIEEDHGWVVLLSPESQIEEDVCDKKCLSVKAALLKPQH